MNAAAAALRALHVPGDPVVLPNVWDPPSARTVAAAGFAAIATSSGAIAGALGYPDGEAMPVAEMLDAIARIVDAVDLPVTADVERGFGLAPAELVERLAATGAVGCNLEDSVPGKGEMVDPRRQADFLAAVREATRHSGLDLVVNARIDVLRRGDGRVEDVVERARLYRESGADCVFPIFAADPALIRTVVEASGAPVNVLFTPKTPSLPELARLGVARVSFGSGLRNALLAEHQRMLERIAAGESPYPDRPPAASRVD